MQPVFGYRSEVSTGSARYEALFVFLPLDRVRAVAIEGALKACIEDNRISPDLIVFVASQVTDLEFRPILSDPSLVERYAQFQRCKGVALLTYRGDGAPNAAHWLDDRGASSIVSPAALIEAARLGGLSLLADRDGVVVKAPPGSYFRNPSGGRRSYFIRAGLMCRSSIEATFVAFAMLPLLARAERFYRRPPNLVWVDTMGIAYLAYALVDLAQRTRTSDLDPPQIRSFSSYGGFRHAIPGPGDFPLYLVSASTSGGLAQDILAEGKGRIDSRTIGTLIGAYEGQYPDVVFNLPAHRRGPAMSAVDTLREIRVSGEDFEFSPGEPKSVVLKGWPKGYSFPASFAQIQGKGIVHYFKRVSAERTPKALFVDDNALVQDTGFQAWIKARATGTLPASIACIVYQNDDASKRMADLVVQTITPYFPGRVPAAVSISELEDRPPQPEATVAVVAAVAGSGMELMRVTKALRAYQPGGARYFLVGVIAARSYQQLNQLRSNLTIADPGTRFALECWCDFAPASEAIHHFRQRELVWLKDTLKQALLNDDEPLRAFAQGRHDSVLRDGVIRPGQPASAPFLSLTQAEHAFDVGKGFSLWVSQFREMRCPADVLFTVACWLQHTRESPLLPQQDRLDDGGFQQSIIGPDTFLRFTDPVIQASILRAARDSELDYRASSASSARAREIIGKFIRLREESAIEFLMALAFRRMRLCTDDAKQVLAAAADQMANDVRVRSLVATIGNQESTPS
jgi:hypothetical protein